MTNPVRVSRRFALKSSIATIALPALAGLEVSRSVMATDVLASANDKPRRFCCIFFPNGVSLPPKSHPLHKEWHWFPHETGADYKLTKPLEPLADLRSEFTVLSGLSHPSLRKMVAHATGDSFLTAADQSQGYTNSISLDQVIANELGQHTRFPSLSLSSDGGVGTPGRAKTLSFSASGKPIPSLSDPRSIFDRLFGVELKSVEQQRILIGEQRSVLDSVLQETRSLSKTLGRDEQTQLDEYLTSVREIERRLTRADRWLDVQKPNLPADDYALHASPGGDAKDYLRAILDLIHAALLTDSTRSITYQITSEDAKGIGDRFPNSLGLKGHHNLSHSAGEKNGYANWARYDRFLTEQFAYFLDKLKSTPDPQSDGSLLDTTLVYYGCSTSRTHKARNYPLILAGAGSMGFRHGQHRRFDEDHAPLSNLYETMLRRLGINADRFADSTGNLDDSV